MGDPLATIVSLNNLGVIYQQIGDYEIARQNYQEILNVGQALNDKLTIVRALNGLSSVTYCQEEYALAKQYVEQQLSLSRELGEKVMIAAGLDTLGHILVQQGEIKKGVHCHCQGLKLQCEIGHKIEIADALNDLGRSLAQSGHYHFALRSLQKSLSLKQEISPKKSSSTLYTLSVMLWHWSNQKEKLVIEANLSKHLEAMPSVSMSATKQMALQLLGFATHHLQQLQEKLPPPEISERQQVLAEAEVMFSPESVQTIYQFGQTSLTLEGAVTLALSLH